MTVRIKYMVEQTNEMPDLQCLVGQTRHRVPRWSNICNTTRHHFFARVGWSGWSKHDFYLGR